jgi:hypothetical protein
MSVGTVGSIADGTSGGSHTLPVHRLPAQSATVAHAWPAAQPAHGPPQSTSLSAPSRAPFPHVAGRQTFAWHTPVAQSAPVMQRPPAGQGPHPPPQSTSISPPFCTPSEQLGS